MITFLSVEIGFCITALTIIAGSSFAQRLYEIEPLNNNGTTLLHQFIERFKRAVYCSVATISLILIYLFVDCSSSLKFIYYSIKLPYTSVLNAIIGILFVYSLYYFYSLFNQFCLFMLQETREFAKQKGVNDSKRPPLDRNK